jgi:hypothetical protein
MENANFIVLNVMLFILIIAAGHAIVKKFRQDRLDQSIHNDIEQTLKIYQAHINHQQEQINQLAAKNEDLLRQNAELKNINQTMLSDNTYLRDKLNQEKKW